MAIKNNRLAILFALAVVLIILSGCAKTVSEVKSPDFVGKQVSIKGTVQNTIKLGQLSGYTLKDDTGSIAVSSKSLPEEGAKITAKGTLMKDTLLGYYILAK